MSLGLIAALGAGYGLWWWSGTYQRTVPVLVAARDIQAHTVLSESDVTTRLVPVGGQDPAAIQDKAQVVGRLAVSPIYRGETFRHERLADPEGFQMTGTGLRVVARPGERLVGLAVDLAAAAGGSIQPGDSVDLYVVAPGATYLAVAGATVAELRTGSGGVFQPGTQAGAPAVVVLRLPEGQVRDALEATAKGKVVLVRRPQNR